MKHYEFKESLSDKPFERSEIKDGDIVAFDYKHGRGVALMQDGLWFYSAYNLSGQNEVWYYDSMPVEIQLLHPSKDDMFLAIDHLPSEINDDDNLPGDLVFWKNQLQDADMTVMQAIEKMQQAIKNHKEIQDHIVKRLQKERNNEKDAAESQKKWYEDEAKEQDEKIKKLEIQIKELEVEVDRLKQQPTEDSFVKRLVKETKKLYKHERAKAEVIRQILYKVGRSDAEAELDAWIEGKEKSTTIHVAGDLVQNKNVDNEVNGVAAGATGISVHKMK